jgi:hypothetical protein
MANFQVFLSRVHSGGIGMIADTSFPRLLALDPGLHSR